MLSGLTKIKFYSQTHNDIMPHPQENLVQLVWDVPRVSTFLKAPPSGFNRQKRLRMTALTSCRINPSNWDKTRLEYKSITEERFGPICDLWMSCGSSPAQTQRWVILPSVYHSFGVKCPNLELSSWGVLICVLCHSEHSGWDSTQLWTQTSVTSAGASGCWCDERPSAVVRRTVQLRNSGTQSDGRWTPGPPKFPEADCSLSKMLP